MSQTVVNLKALPLFLCPECGFAIVNPIPYPASPEAFRIFNAGLADMTKTGLAKMQCLNPECSDKGVEYLIQLPTWKAIRLDADQPTA